jgi:phospholipase C
VLYGEALISTVYEALRNSPDWASTLLIIIFDEHGGTYDHVPTPPPCAVSPDGIVIPCGQPGGSDFDFKRFGVRVPAVLVSPLIEPGTVCHTQFDHTSVIKTVAKRWLNSQHLTERDKQANDISEVLTLPTPRTDIPDIKPNPAPPFTGCGATLLSPMHREMMLAAAGHLKRLTGESIDVANITTTDQAVEVLNSKEASVRQTQG